MAVSANRSTIIAFGKLILSVGLIGVLLSTVDVGMLVEQIYEIELRYVVFVLVLPHIGILLSTFKWQILLAALGIRAGLRRLFSLYMVGTFFSNFLPTMVGGDAVRSYALYRDKGDASSVIAATFLERLVGLAALLTLLPLIRFQSIIQDRFPMIDWVVGGILASYCVAIAVILMPVSRLTQGFRSQIGAVKKVFDIVQRTHSNVLNFSNHKPVLLSSYLVSLLFYFVTVGTTWFAALSLGVEISYSFLLAIVPMVLLAAFVPVSLNGLGVTEAGYVVFFQLYGISAEEALGIALLLRLRLLLTASIGGLIFSFLRPKVDMQHGGE